MISLQLKLTNNIKFDTVCGKLVQRPGEPWERREDVLISSTDKTIPQLVHEAKKIIAVRPGVYTAMRVSAELLDNDGFSLGDYWKEPMYASILTNGELIFIKGANFIKGAQ